MGKSLAASMCHCWHGIREGERNSEGLKGVCQQATLRLHHP